ncbi:glycosyltransferase family 1 protein [Chitinophaga sp. HK235]|uniref:glycosyltransferase family 4 protein n=1 Tax=Chitinophaga sp. HK235 TaxID=2952571 RepID=UPI001BA9B8AE|nr:glycosyltransferase family 1 protein [Chitinophaga sp. HK235]
MRVYLDNIVFTIQRAGGVSAYWYELLKGVCHSGLSVHLLNAGMAPDNVFEQQMAYQRWPNIRESMLPAGLLRYLPLRYRLPARAVFHGGYLRVSPQKNVLNILTVHDFAHERKLSSAFPRSLVNIRQKAYGIRKADGIICISDSTRQELLHFYPQTDPGKIRVIHHGISDDFFPHTPAHPPGLPALLTQKPFVLYVGGRNHYKNFQTAVATIALLPREYRLIAVGGGSASRPEIQLLQQRIPGRYQLLPVVSNQELNYLYNQAFCLLYPSIYEGFGFPPGEAMKAGCPVVGSNRTSVPEVVGDAGLLAEMPHAETFAACIRQLESGPLRQQLIQKGYRQASLFSWKTTIAETIRFYHHCWNHKFSEDEYPV